MPNGRPILSTDPVSIIKNVDAITDSLGNWIAGPTPQDPIAAAIQTGYRKACDSYSRVPDWVTGMNAAARSVFDSTCDPWLASQGSGGPTLNPPPFEGGQCPVIYNYTRTTTYSDGRAPLVSQRQDTGPLGAPVLTPGEPLSNGNIIWTATITTGEFPGGRNIYQQTLNPTVTPSVAISNVQRLDGQPDSCGSLPPTPGPGPNPRPDPGLGPDDLPFMDDRGRPVVPMPPITDPFGDPVQLPNFPLPPIFDDSTDSGPAAPTGPGSPGTSDDTGEGGESEGEAPENSVLIGVKVDALEAPGYARKVQNVPFDIYIGALYVRLGWPDQLDLQQEAQFFEPGQFFVAPEGATAWRVSAATGYNLRVTPYYVEKEAQGV